MQKIDADVRKHFKIVSLVNKKCELFIHEPFSIPKHKGI